MPASLPSDKRECVTKCVLQGLTCVETSRACGVSTGYVSNVVFQDSLERPVPEPYTLRGYLQVPRPPEYPGHGTIMPLHVLICLQKYGLTELPEGYVVHHINFRKLDNRPANLELVTREEHNTIHWNERKSRSKPVFVPVPVARR